MQDKRFSFYKECVLPVSSLNGYVGGGGVGCISPPIPDLVSQYSKISAFSETKGNTFVAGYKEKRLGNLSREYGRP